MNQIKYHDNFDQMPFAFGQMQFLISSQIVLKQTLKLPKQLPKFRRTNK